MALSAHSICLITFQPNYCPSSLSLPAARPHDCQGIRVAKTATFERKCTKNAICTLQRLATAFIYRVQCRMCKRICRWGARWLLLQYLRMRKAARAARICTREGTMNRAVEDTDANACMCRFLRVNFGFGKRRSRPAILYPQLRH